MGTIADKLNYLNNTKAQIKNEINKIGGNITNETTFRNYVSNIKSIYDKLPKIEGSGSDITLNDTEKALLSLTPEGYASQKTTTGKNLSKIVDGNLSMNGLNVTIENGIITLNGTTTSSLTIKFSNLLEAVIGSSVPTKYLSEEVVSSTLNKTFSISIISGTAPTNGFAVRGYVDGVQNINANSLQNDRSFLKTYSNEGVMNYIGMYTNTDRTFDNFKFTIQLESGNEATEFEKYTFGASPNPDYPQPIKVVTGEQNVEIGGKNLFDKDNTRIIKMYIAQQSDYVATKTTLQNRSFIIPCQPNTTYTISKKNVTSEFRATTVNEYIPDPTSTEQHYDCYNKVLNNSGTIITITTDSLSKYLVVNYANLNNDSETASLNEMMVEEGSTATEYEPYYMPQTYPLSLGNIELARINDYKNFLFKNEIGSKYYNADLELDSWYVCKNIGKVILDGTESWVKYSSTRKDRLFDYSFYTQEQISNMELVNFNYTQYIKSNMSKLETNARSVRDCLKEGVQAGGKKIYFAYSQFKNYTIEDFKNWLSANNIIVYYILGTPTYEKITDTTLIQQLENMNNNARSYKGTTIIECSSVSEENETLQVSTVALKDLDLLNTNNNTLSTTNTLNNIQPLNTLDNTNELSEIEEPTEEYEEL